MNVENRTKGRKPALICAAAMAIAAGAIRLLPHPWNFTPVVGLGLFGGARLRSRWAYLLLFGVMAVSDLLLWAIHGINYIPFNPWVYGCFLLSVLWGRFCLQKGGVGRVAVVSVLNSVLFFLVTNFGAWQTLSSPLTQMDGTILAPFYTHDLSGLFACYAAALPFAGSNAPPLGFFGNQLVGDLFYSAFLFGAYAWLRRGALTPQHEHLSAPARIS